MTKKTSVALSCDRDVVKHEELWEQDTEQNRRTEVEQNFSVQNCSKNKAKYLVIREVR